MSRKKRLLCILLALAVVIGGVCCWQRNNLRALGMAMKLSQDELRIHRLARAGESGRHR